MASSKINLLSFCEPDHFRPLFTTPFLFSDKTVSTQGQILLFSPLTSKYRVMPTEYNLFKSTLEGVLDELPLKSYAPFPLVNLDSDYCGIGECTFQCRYVKLIAGKEGLLIHVSKKQNRLYFKLGKQSGVIAGVIA